MPENKDNNSINGNDKKVLTEDELQKTAGAGISIYYTCNDCMYITTDPFAESKLCPQCGKALTQNIIRW